MRRNFIYSSFFLSAFFLSALVLSGCSDKVTDVTDDVTDDQTTDQDSELPTISELTYPVVGTNQTKFFNASSVVSTITSGDDFYGQNANYPGLEPSYTTNGDGTVTDNNTGLMWTQSLDLNGDGKIDYDDKLMLADALDFSENLTIGGHDDWRIPTIKELYSLIEFNGIDCSSYTGSDDTTQTPFIDRNYFDFGYGDQTEGDRILDAQCGTQTYYTSVTMKNNKTIFGVNFADGRIKGYGYEKKPFYFFFVRGNENYGKNQFVDNGDHTITDSATGLMWAKYDNAADPDCACDAGMTWKDALAYADGSQLAGYDDWRLPDSKELNSLVDYDRGPDATSSAAIDPLFECTSFVNELGETDWPYFWTSTTHEAYTGIGAAPSVQAGDHACYFSFGRALGYMDMQMITGWYDVHGAGSQKSDPKSGDPSEYPQGHGPQGDAVRIYNYVRLVRNVKVSDSNNESTDTTATADEDVWKFVIVNDTHIPSSLAFDTIANYIAQNEVIEAIVVAGDLTETGIKSDSMMMVRQLSKWSDAMDPFYDNSIKVLTVRGNHEADASASEGAWNDFFSGEYAVPMDAGSLKNMNYTYSMNDALFIGLDEYAGADKIDTQWLEDILSHNTKPHVFVYGHEAAFKIFHDDCLDDDTANRDAFWELLKKYDVKTYICGHDHFFDLAQVDDDIYQLCVGTGGGWTMDKYSDYNGENSNYSLKRLDHVASYGYVVVTISDSKVSYTWKGLDLTDGEITETSKALYSYEE